MSLSHPVPGNRAWKAFHEFQKTTVFGSKGAGEKGGGGGISSDPINFQTNALAQSRWRATDGTTLVCTLCTPPHIPERSSINPLTVSVSLSQPYVPLCRPSAPLSLTARSPHSTNLALTWFHQSRHCPRALVCAIEAQCGACPPNRRGVSFIGLPSFSPRVSPGSQSKIQRSRWTSHGPVRNARLSNGRSPSSPVLPQCLRWTTFFVRFV